MPTTTNANGLLVLKNLFKAVTLYNDALPERYADRMAGNTYDSQQAFEQIAQVKGIGMPLITGEYGLVPTEDMVQGATAQYRGQKRTLQIRMSDEFFIDDQYGIAKGYGTQLATVFNHAEEFAGAVFLNGALNTALATLPTLQPFSSAAQPLDVGVDTNTFVTQQTLSILALEDARNLLMQQKADKGYPAPSVGDVVLEVAPKNAMLAVRLTGAPMFPTTNNNDKNPVGALVKEVIVNPYFSNPEWWCLRMADKSKHKRFKLTRYGFRMMGDPLYDQDTDSWKVGAKAKYVYGAMDYRGTFFSTPS